MFRDSQATIAKLPSAARAGRADRASTTSARATRRSATCAASRSTSSRSPGTSSSPLERARRTWAFARAIVALGRTLGLTIVAEGIEERGQLDRLRELGCQLGQGFLLGRPVPPADLEDLLRANAAAAQAIDAAASARAAGIRGGWPNMPEPTGLLRLRH